MSRKPRWHAGLRNRLGTAKQMVAVKNTRGGIGKKDMIHNNAMLNIEVDPETYEVRADGELLVCEPATSAAHGATVFPVLMTLRATPLSAPNICLEHAVGDCGDGLAEERHLRRKLSPCNMATRCWWILQQTVKLEDRDCLILEDGRLVQIIASDEELMEVRARDAAHLTQLAWHIGNRHLEAQIEATRILIRRDHVIATMLEQLGATVNAGA